MAANATIYKMALNIANMDSHYYAEHNLTLAKHPSENEFRMMIRLAAFVFNADEKLLFGEGIAVEEEPDLWKKELNGDISLWVDLGQTDEKRLRKVCGKSDEVIIYTYAEGPALAWWKSMENKLSRFKNLKVVFLRIDGDIEALCKRTMDLQCNISDGELSLIYEDLTVLITPEIWMPKT